MQNSSGESETNLTVPKHGSADAYSGMAVCSFFVLLQMKF